MGLISRVSSRTYRKSLKNGLKFLKIDVSSTHDEVYRSGDFIAGERCLRKQFSMELFSRKILKSKFCFTENPKSDQFICESCDDDNVCVADNVCVCMQNHFATEISNDVSGKAYSQKCRNMRSDGFFGVFVSLMVLSACLVFFYVVGNLNKEAAGGGSNGGAYAAAKLGAKETALMDK